MASGAYNYVVTAHKPTSVTACATGNINFFSNSNNHCINKAKHKQGLLTIL